MTASKDPRGTVLPLSKRRGLNEPSGPRVSAFHSVNSPRKRLTFLDKARVLGRQGSPRYGPPSSHLHFPIGGGTVNRAYTCWEKRAGKVLCALLADQPDFPKKDKPQPRGQCSLFSAGRGDSPGWGGLGAEILHCQEL